MTYYEPFSRSRVNRAKLSFIIHETFQHNASIFPASLMFTSRFQDESEKIDYHTFLSGINWRENPTPAVLPDVTVKVSLNVVWMQWLLSRKIVHLFCHQTHTLRRHSLSFAKAATCTWECLCQGPGHGPHKLWAPPSLISSKSALGKTHSTTTLKWSFYYSTVI